MLYKIFFYETKLLIQNFDNEVLGLEPVNYFQLLPHQILVDYL